MFFFFKQKTAYEMRISDWSSDVCSSDLIARCLKHLRFPLIFEILVAIQHGKQAKAHRPHVERSNLGSEPRGRTQAFFQRHGGMSSGCDIDHRVATLLDDFQKWLDRTSVV